MLDLLLTCEFKGGSKRYTYKAPLDCIEPIERAMKDGTLPEDFLIEGDLGFGETNSGHKVSISAACTGDAKEFPYAIVSLASADIFERGGMLHSIVQERKEVVAVKKQEKEVGKMGKKSLSNLVRVVEDFFAFSITGQVAVRDGVDYFSFGEGGVTDVGEFVMDELAIDAYVMPTAVDALAKGDVILHGDEVGFFVEAKEDGTIVIMLTNGTVATVSPTQNILFGNAKMVQRAFNPMGSLGGGSQQGLGDVANLLPILLMKGEGGKGDKDKLLTMMLFQQGAGGGNNPGGVNPLVLASLL